MLLNFARARAECFSGLRIARGQRVLVLVMRDWTDVLDARSDSRLFCMVIDEPLFVSVNFLVNFCNWFSCIL